MKENLKSEKKSKKKLKKKDFEKFFYHFYFKDISEREGIPIEHFFHPKNSTPSKTVKMKNAPKTINNTYIQNISKSPKFLESFKNYLNNNLLNDYIKQINSKFDGLLKKWEFEMNEGENKLHAV